MAEHCPCECSCGAAAAQEQQAREDTCPGYKPRVFGMQYRPRQAEPSMFELLSWNGSDRQADIEKEQRRLDLQFECCKNKQQPKSTTVAQAYTTHYKSEYPPEMAAENEERVLQRIRQNHEGRTKPITNLIKDRLYYQEEPVKVGKTTSSTSSKKRKLRQQQSKKKYQRKERPKLDEEKDKDIISKRKQRIKQFNRETRNLPNTAFKTYFGKPVFENYGRSNTTGTGHMLSHNVMPHCGENHPKHQETYESALINGHKYIKPTAEMPRKPDENYVCNDIDETQSEKQRRTAHYHLDIPKPDLINAERFASKLESPRLTQSQVVTKSLPKPAIKSSIKVTKSVIAAVARPVTAMEVHHREVAKQPSKSGTTQAETVTKASHPQKKMKKNQREPKKPEEPQERELKFMNERDHFMDEVKEKKLRNSRLAYKVTECYPVVQIVGNDNPLPSNSKQIETELTNPKDYKKIDKKWTERIPAAGKPAEKHVDIRQLFTNVAVV